MDSGHGMRAIASLPSPNTSKNVLLYEPDQAWLIIANKQFMLKDGKTYLHQV